MAHSSRPHLANEIEGFVKKVSEKIGGDLEGTQRTMLAALNENIIWATEEGFSNSAGVAVTAASDRTLPMTASGRIALVWRPHRSARVHWYSPSLGPSRDGTKCFSMWTAKSSNRPRPTHTPT